jgi:hypothetical protein
MKPINANQNGTISQIQSLGLILSNMAACRMQKPMGATFCRVFMDWRIDTDKDFVATASPHSPPGT